MLGVLGVLCIVLCGVCVLCVVRCVCCVCGSDVCVKQGCPSSQAVKCTELRGPCPPKNELRISGSRIHLHVAAHGVNVHVHSVTTVE